MNKFEEAPSHTYDDFWDNEKPLQIEHNRRLAKALTAGGYALLASGVTAVLLDSLPPEQNLGLAIAGVLLAEGGKKLQGR